MIVYRGIEIEVTANWFAALTNNGFIKSDTLEGIKAMIDEQLGPIETTELAARLAAGLTTKKRRDEHETTIIVRRDGLDNDLDEMLQDIALAAHGVMFPDDTRYSMLRNVLEHIADGGERDDLDTWVPMYTTELTGWLASSPDRLVYVDDAIRDGFVDQNPTTALLSSAYFRELEEVYDNVIEFLNNAVNE